MVNSAQDSAVTLACAVLINIIQKQEVSDYETAKSNSIEFRRS